MARRKRCAPRRDVFEKPRRQPGDCRVGRGVVCGWEHVSWPDDGEEKVRRVAEIEGRRDGRHDPLHRLPLAGGPEPERRRRGDGVVRQVAEMEDPREPDRRVPADPFARRLESEERLLPAQHDPVVRSPVGQVDQADLGVERGHDEKGVPVADESPHRSGPSRVRHQQCERDEEPVDDEERGQAAAGHPPDEHGRGRERIAERPAVDRRSTEQALRPDAASRLGVLRDHRTASCVSMS